MENTTKQNCNTRDSTTESLWQGSVSKLNIENGPVNENVFDSIIVGGGITGITTALLLQQAGQRCLIIETHQIGFGTTGGTSAHLNTFFDTTYAEIESNFNKEAAALVAKCGKEAMGMIYNFCDTLHIDCDLEQKKAYLFAQNEEEDKQLDEILDSSKKVGLTVHKATENGVPIPFQKVILFDDQGQFHPLKYIKKLAEEFIRIGGVILENSPVGKPIAEGDLQQVIVSGQKFSAVKLIYATHIPPGVNRFSFRCAPYRSYVIAVRLSDNKYPSQLAYDMMEPYHYFRTHQIDGKEYLLIGGEDHKTGHSDPEKAFENLISYACQYFKIDSVAYKWSSQYYVPVDGLPYIGLMPGEKNIYMATGYNGNGMTFGTIAAKIISDQITGTDNIYSDLFSPSRLKPIAGISEFIKETADVAYHFIADRFKFEALKSLKELKPGEGTVAEYQGERIALYKDHTNKVHMLSPVCTHAGCIVNFNPVEKSWDCPCHGGRYDVYGKVLNGPARKDLEKIDFDQSN